MKSSRGGLVVERLLHKKCHSATVGLNLRKVWFINRPKPKDFVAVTCRTPGNVTALYDECPYDSYTKPIYD